MTDRVLTLFFLILVTPFLLAIFAIGLILCEAAWLALTL